jgi:hypothetical protein
MKRRRFATVSFFFFGSVVARRAIELGRVPERKTETQTGEALTTQACVRARIGRDAKN